MKRRSVRSKRTKRNIRRSVRSKRTQKRNLRTHNRKHIRKNTRSKKRQNVRKMKRSKKSTQKGGNNYRQKLEQCKIKNTELKQLNNKLTKDYLSKQLDLHESVGDIKTIYTNLRERRLSMDEMMADWNSRVPRNTRRRVSSKSKDS